MTQSTITHDQIIDWAGDMFWVDIHLGVALLCASLPTYRPLVRAGAAFISNTVLSYGSRSGSVALTSTKGYAPFGDEDVPQRLKSNSKPGMQQAGSSFPRDWANAGSRGLSNHGKAGIRVQRTVDVVEGPQVGNA